MTNNMHSKTVIYKYIFALNDNKKCEFTVSLDKKTLDLIKVKKDNIPEWALLEFNKCPNCPLDKKEHKYCPTAESVTDLIDFFKESASFEKVNITVESYERTYHKNTSLQKGLSSLLGLYMACSGCPVLKKLKPMARFHLPFATMEETTFRAMSTYLLGQFFMAKKKRNPDWDLKDLVKFYDEIRAVNNSFHRRLQAASNKDANLNALVILDTFAYYVLAEIDFSLIEEFNRLFDSYME